MFCVMPFCGQTNVRVSLVYFVGGRGSCYCYDIVLVIALKLVQLIYNVLYFSLIALSHCWFSLELC